MNDLERHLESIVHSWVDEYSWDDDDAVIGAMGRTPSTFAGSIYEFEEVVISRIDDHKHKFVATLTVMGHHRDSDMTNWFDTVHITAEGIIRYDGTDEDWIIDDYNVSAEPEGYNGDSDEPSSHIFDRPDKLFSKIFSFQPSSWYRGHADEAWELKTSIAREPNSSLSLERALRLRFENHSTFLDPTSHPLGISKCNFLMQHHGLPTRLLDWTTSPLVALYFAVCDDKKDNVDACIWKLDPSGLNHSYKENYPLECDEGLYTEVSDKPKFLAIHAPYTSLRMMAQRSEFTLHTHYSAINDDNRDPVFLKKITISKKIKSELRDRLNSLGINRGSLFPDLDNIARTVADDLL